MKKFKISIKDFENLDEIEKVNEPLKENNDGE